MNYSGRIFMIVNSYFLKFFKITFVVDYTRISSAFAIKRHGIRRFISVYFFPVALCLYSNAFASSAVFAAIQPGA